MHVTQVAELKTVRANSLDALHTLKGVAARLEKEVATQKPTGRAGEGELVAARVAGARAELSILARQLQTGQGRTAALETQLGTAVARLALLQDRVRHLAELPITAPAPATSSSLLPALAASLAVNAVSLAAIFYRPVQTRQPRQDRAWLQVTSEPGGAVAVHQDRNNGYTDIYDEIYDYIVAS